MGFASFFRENRSLGEGCYILQVGGKIPQKNSLSTCPQPLFKKTKFNVHRWETSMRDTDKV